jgi:clan AA aspartic protease
VITGTVLNRRATVPLRVLGPSGQATEVAAVLDTGFNGFLTLPTFDVIALALSFLNYFNAGLADGSRVRLEVYAATVVWDGAERDIELLAAGKDPLLGTSLLDGHDVSIQFTDGGLVTIDTL